MSPETIFHLSNIIALLGWIFLVVFSPFLHAFDKPLIGIVIALFILTYFWLLAQNFQFSEMEKFSTLDGVMELFTN